MKNLRHYLNSLCEPGASRAHGAWVEGHVDRADFCSAILGEYNRFVSLGSIHHGFVRMLRGKMHFTLRRGRGAAPATWTEW